MGDDCIFCHKTGIPLGDCEVNGAGFTSEYHCEDCHENECFVEWEPRKGGTN